MGEGIGEGAGKGTGEGKKIEVIYLSSTGLVYFPSIKKSTTPCRHDSVYVSSKYF